MVRVPQGMHYSRCVCPAWANLYCKVRKFIIISRGLKSLMGQLCEPISKLQGSRE